MTNTEQMEFIDLDSINIEDFEEQVGDLEVLEYFPPGKYEWNIDRAGIKEKLDENTGRTLHTISITFKMKSVVSLLDKTQEDLVPETGRILMYVPNPVAPPDSPKNFPYRKFLYMKKKLLDPEQIRGESLATQLEILVAMYKENNSVIVSVRDNKNPNNGNVSSQRG